MKIRKNNLIDLYRRLLNFISSNYPDALIVENELNTVITYPGELGRILIQQDPSESSLIVRILLKLGEKITSNNSKLFYVATIDELNCVKAGVQISLEMMGGESFSGNIATIAGDGQGYLADLNGDVIGVVDLSMIPTNAFVMDTDVVNQQEVVEPEEKPSERTIRKFFRR